MQSSLALISMILECMPRKPVYANTTIMAPSTLPTLALLTISYITYRLIKSLITNRRFRKFAKLHGCEEPVDTTGSFPYGWDTVYRLM